MTSATAEEEETGNNIVINEWVDYWFYENGRNVLPNELILSYYYNTTILLITIGGVLV